MKDWVWSNKIPNLEYDHLTLTDVMYHEAIVKKNYLLLGMSPEELDRLPLWMKKIWDMMSKEEHIKAQTPVKQP